MENYVFERMKKKGARLVTISFDGRLIYHFFLNGRFIRKEVEPPAPTLTGLYPSAEFYERELAEKYGLRFEGHKTRRLFT